VATEPTTPPASSGRAPSLPYMPGVDGLRALAVAAVVLYHVGAGWLPGGFLGVDVFLVISGYLITSLLLAERARSGRIDLKRFWLRRARRLLPALLAMIAATLAAMLVLHPGEVERLHGAVLAALGYISNWYLIFAHLPYFEQFGRPSIFQHLWSLAVEEQFYLLWPPILAVGIAVFGRRKLLVGVLAGIAGSTVLAWILFQPFTDPSRIYYGTDTRAVGLLAGVALAFVWPVSRLRPTSSAGARAALDVVGLAALGLLLAAMAVVGELDERLYRGGFLVVALATAALIASAAHPSSRVGRGLGVPLLVWIGLRSYGIYLWHWPVLMLTRGREDVPIDGVPLALAQVALTIGLAELSYRYVETPIRRGGLAGLRASFRRGREARFPARRVAAWSGGLALVALVIAVALVPGRTPVIPGLSGVASAAGGTPAATGPPPVSPKAERVYAARHDRGPEAARAGPVLAVGDSVMLGARSALQSALGPRAVIDAAVSRQFSAGARTVVSDVRRTGARTVVVHLGTNGFVQFDDLKAMLDALRGLPRVVLVTVRVPDRWEGSVNDALEYAARHWRNVVIADWHRVADGASGLLVDGVHPDALGQRLYARTIARAVRAARASAGAASAP
jgi:peptidoglycan/LPS O-acetylase OafA/YrhL